MRGWQAKLFDIEVALRAGRDLRANRKRLSNSTGPTDILLCIVDHFEPQVGGADASTARKRLEDWLERYPKIADRHHDSEGRVPAHSFFYPWDEYDPWEFCNLQELCRKGYGEIELHLHHRDDTETSLRKKIGEALKVYREKGALAHWPDGGVAFGFIHGNWALDNSRQDNGRNYCGVNNELEILRDLGCYADFTFPAWQQTAQPRQTNCIYYATDDPQPKSYDNGVFVETGKPASGDLMLVQGPLVPHIMKSGKGMRVAMDDSDIAHYRRYEPARLNRWASAGIHVHGRLERIFIKLHCHGAEDKNREIMLGEDLETLFNDAESRYNDGEHFNLHYVTAREMFNVIKATEAGADVSISNARDWILKPPKKLNA